MKESDKKIFLVVAVIALMVWGVYQVVASRINLSRSDASEGVKKILKADCSKDKSDFGVKLSWNPDDDSAYNVLQKKELGSESWQSIFKGSDLGNNVYFDTQIFPGASYEYRIYMTPNRQSNIIPVNCSL
jgi:hypothetical protein